MYIHLLQWKAFKLFYDNVKSLVDFSSLLCNILKFECIMKEKFNSINCAMAHIWGKV